jgi:hypothetical protein
MKNVSNNKAGIDKGSVYVLVILFLLVFAAYILVGGVLPTKLPGANYNLVSVITPVNQPTTSSLQMHAFFGATFTPVPIGSSHQPTPTTSPYNPAFVDCGYQSSSQEVPLIWGYTIDSTSASGNNVALKIFYAYKYALSLGSGTVSLMNDHPTDHVVNPKIGNNGPALFLTDITTIATDKSGDFELGGKVFRPSDIYGTWKSAGGKNPDANGIDLGQNADEWSPANAKAGSHDTTFGSEIIWKFSNLSAMDPSTKTYLHLQVGHSYRAEVILHDGENPDGTEALCVTFKNPTP